MGRNKETMKRVLKFISPYKAKIIIMLLTALVTVGFTLYTPILIGNGVDNIVGPGNVNTAGLLKVLGALAVIVVGNEPSYQSGYLQRGAGCAKPGVCPSSGGAGILYRCQSARRYFKPYCF